MRQHYLSFLHDKTAAITLLFAFSMLVMGGAVGAGVDYSRSLDSRSAMLTALDAAVQTAAKTQGTQAAQTAAFNTTFNEYASRIKNLQNPTATLVFESSKLSASATGNVPTSVLTIVGIKQITIGVTSDLVLGGNSVEFAIAIDVSGSMDNSFSGGTTLLGAAKTAANSFITTALANIAPGSTAKFGIVPFTMNVNIGTANAKYVTGTQNPLFNGTQWAGCVLERAPPHHISNAYDGNALSPAGMWQAYISPPEPNQGGSCENASNGTNLGYNRIDSYGSKDPVDVRGPNQNCVAYPISPLTTDATKIRSAINALQSPSNNGTIFGVGVSWAYRLLTPDAPFPEATPLNSSVRKVIIVFTDGAQTTEERSNSCSKGTNSITSYAFDPASLKLGGKLLSGKGPRDYFSAYGYIYDSDPFNYKYNSYSDVDPTLDTLSLAACAAAKKDNIDVYTLAVSQDAGPGTSVYNTLQACASSSDNFFYVKTAAEFKIAFDKIAAQATRLRRSK